MERKLLAINVLCVVGAVLLAHVASSEPPTADRVGFPKDYRTQFKVLGVTVRDMAPEVLTAYANEQAASVSSRAELPFPEGSIIVMEFSYARRDANNQIQRDANGVVLKGEIEHVDVMFIMSVFRREVYEDVDSSGKAQRKREDENDAAEADAATGYAYDDDDEARGRPATPGEAVARTDVIVAIRDMISDEDD